MRAITSFLRSLAFGALACATLGACGGGDPSPDAQDVTFNVQTGPEPRLAQGESVSVALEVIDEDGGPAAGNDADESEPFTAQVEVRVVTPHPPGISVDFSPELFTPNQPGTINVRVAPDAQLGRHELALEARIRDGSTRYYRTFQITVTGNCAPGSGAIARIIPSAFERTIALTESGDAYLWGANRIEQFSTPVLVPVSDVPFTPKTLDFHTGQLVDVLRGVSSASSHGGVTAFVRADTGAFQLVARHYPSALGAPGGRAGWALVNVEGSGGFRQIVASAGSESSEHFALHNGGTVWRLPAHALDGTELEPISFETHRPFPVFEDIEQLAAGNRHLIARREDGAVLMVRPHDVPSEPPFVVDRVSGAIDIAAGSAFSLAATEDGTVLAWGSNTEGQLGRGATSETGEPSPVVTLDGAALRNIVAVAAGARHALALGSDGSVWSWGAGADGQLGTGRTSVRPYAERIPDLIAASISAARNSSFAVLPSGRASAWGENDRGQLGDGTDTLRDVPAPVLGLGTGLSMHCHDADDPPPDPAPLGWQQLGPAVSDAGAMPAIVLDSARRPVVALIERDAANVARLQVRRLVDGEWRNIGAVLNPAPALAASQPALVIDAADRPIVAWVQTAPDLSLLMVARFNGTSWQTLCGRNGSCDINYEVDARVHAPSLALSASGRLAAAWIEADLVSAKHFDGSAWLAFDGGPRPIDAAGVGLRTRIAFDREGAAHIAWTARNEAGIDIVRVARDAGLWVRLPQTPRPDVGDRMPDFGLAVPAIGNPIVAWVQTSAEGSQVHAAQWGGASWTLLGNEPAISNSATFQGFAFGLSADSLPYVAQSHLDSDTGAGRMDMERFISTFWSPFSLFHGQLSELALALPSTGPIDSPHFVWVQNGAVEVWRFTP